MPAAQILLVEDERIIARDLSIRLRRLGHTVTGIVPSGAAAIAQVTINRPQLIFMDIILEGPLDGIETVERIRALGDVPVIYVTAHADPTTRQRAWQTGPRGYLVKPFSDRELASSIGSALGASEDQPRPTGG
jgi:CheY-like chemotaxis protein